MECSGRSETQFIDICLIGFVVSFQFREWKKRRKYENDQARKPSENRRLIDERKAKENRLWDTEKKKTMMEIIWIDLTSSNFDRVKREKHLVSFDLFFCLFSSSLILSVIRRFSWSIQSIFLSVQSFDQFSWRTVVSIIVLLAVLLFSPTWLNSPFDSSIHRSNRIFFLRRHRRDSSNPNVDNGTDMNCLRQKKRNNCQWIKFEEFVIFLIDVTRSLFFSLSRSPLTYFHLQHGKTLIQRWCKICGDFHPHWRRNDFDFGLINVFFSFDEAERANVRKIKLRGIFSYQERIFNHE